MFSALQSMQGQFNEMQITMAKMCSSMMHGNTPRKDTSSSKKRNLDDAAHIEEDSRKQESSLDVPASSSEKTFSDLFKRTSEGYSSASLGAKSAEEFLYDWYAKSLGTVKGNTVTLASGRWQIAVGHKPSSDNQGDAKNVVRLAEKLGSEVQLKTMRALQPDAAKDASYSTWEMNMKATAKTLTKLVGEFLIMKEGKVGNAKAYTVGALARRWKQLKYPDPTEEERRQLQSPAIQIGNKAAAASSCSSSSSSSSSSSNSNSSSSSSSSSSSNSASSKRTVSNLPIV